jgi:hypothetical protein
MKTLTINELAKQLATMIEMGYGKDPVVYMDEDSMIHFFDTGVHDIWERQRPDDSRIVILG